jgi:hypothetical protein
MYSGLTSQHLLRPTAGRHHRNKKELGLKDERISAGVRLALQPPPRSADSNSFRRAGNVQDFSFNGNAWRGIADVLRQGVLSVQSSKIRRAFRGAFSHRNPYDFAPRIIKAGSPRGDRHLGVEERRWSRLER